MTHREGSRGSEEAEPLLARYDIRTHDDAHDLPAGWLPLVERLLMRLVALGWDRRLAGAKEKMGLLSFEVETATPEIRAAIDHAEIESAKVCEVCSAHAQLRRARRIGAWCDHHAPEGAERLELRVEGDRRMVVRSPARIPGP